MGILVAVGIVAYTGYTKSAKKSASKAVHATIVKYVSAELARCNIEKKYLKALLTVQIKINQAVRVMQQKTCIHIFQLDFT